MKNTKTHETKKYQLSNNWIIMFLEEISECAAWKISIVDDNWNSV